MDDRNDPGSETTTAAESGNSAASSTRTRIGLDVGTSKVVTARGDSTRSDGGAQLNAFFVVPYSSLHESTLQNNRVPFFREGEELVVYGSASEKFAHMPAVHHGFFNTPLGTTARLAVDNLSHGGSTLHFRSFLVVTDDLGGQGTLGVFVAANSATGAAMVQAVAERIVAEYFPPQPQPEATVPEGGASRAREYAGQYRASRRSYTQFEQVLNVGTINVTATQEGYLVVAIGGPPLRFVEIGQDLFRQINGDATIAFVRDERGAISHLVAYIGTVERVAFFASPQWLALVMITTLLTCIGVLIGAVRRRSADAMTGIAIAWLTFMIAISSER